MQNVYNLPLWSLFIVYHNKQPPVNIYDISVTY